MAPPSKAHCPGNVAGCDQYGADKDTVSRAISEVLEPEGLVWTVPERGTLVRHGLGGRSTGRR